MCISKSLSPNADIAKGVLSYSGQVVLLFEGQVSVIKGVHNICVCICGYVLGDKGNGPRLTPVQLKAMENCIWTN